jgi:diacylglycerol kinase (ATP)
VKTRVIVNPTAGAGRAPERIAALAPRIEAAFGELEWRESRSADHVTDLARECADRGDARVIVAGGDGTIHFAARGLVHSDTALGILPVGSGNDIARSVGLPLEAGPALDVLAGEHRRRIDVGCVGSRVYCCVLGVGMDADAIERINASRLLGHGKLLYTWAALRTLLTYRPQLMRISWGNRMLEDEVVFAAATNTGTYAGGMRIAPDADVADGRLDLCVVRRASLPSLLASFARIARGDGERSRGIVADQATRVTIEAERPMAVTLDGELTDLTTPIEASALPGALCVLGAPVACAARHDPRPTLVAA